MITISDTSRTVQRIVDTSQTVPLLDPTLVAVALGAEPMSGVDIGGSPLGRIAATTAIGDARQARNPQLAFSDEQAKQLDALAAALEANGQKPSVGEIVVAMCNLSLRVFANPKADLSPLAQELVAIAACNPVVPSGTNGTQVPDEAISQGKE